MRESSKSYRIVNIFNRPYRWIRVRGAEAKSQYEQVSEEFRNDKTYRVVNLFNRPYRYVRLATSSIAMTFDAIVHEIRDDIAAVKDRDPAARNNLEILFLYSGVHAILAYRVAHKLYLGQHYFSARVISQVARHYTGIEIHPGAKIGKGLFIDHGMGVVIGETAEIGNNCTLYQGVTLGGTGKQMGKRHPTLGNNVMVGAGAKVLGPFRIGDNSKIAAGAVVLDEVPPNSTAVGIPAQVVRRGGVKVGGDLDQIHIPDPVQQEICRLELRIGQLEAELAAKKPAKTVAKTKAKPVTE